jgi:hypothetical protein
MLTWGVSRKKRIITLPAYAALVLATNPIRYWPLDDAVGSTTARELVKGFQRTVTSVTFGATGPTNAGSMTAATFGSVAGSRIGVLDAELAADFNHQEFTMIWWAKVSAAGVWTDGTFDLAFQFRKTGTPTNLIRSLKLNGSNQFSFSYFGNGVSKVRNKSSFSPTDWVQYALTISISNDRMRGFVNGVQEGADVTGLSAWSSSPLNAATLGNDDDAGSPWNGPAAHYTLYASERTPTHIADFYAMAA